MSVDDPHEIERLYKNAQLNLPSHEKMPYRDKRRYSGQRYSRASRLSVINYLNDVSTRRFHVNSVSRGGMDLSRDNIDFDSAVATFLPWIGYFIVGTITSLLYTFYQNDSRTRIIWMGLFIFICHFLACIGLSFSMFDLVENHSLLSRKKFLGYACFPAASLSAFGCVYGNTEYPDRALLFVPAYVLIVYPYLKYIAKEEILCKPYWFICTACTIMAEIFLFYVICEPQRNFFYPFLPIWLMISDFFIKKLLQKTYAAHNNCYGITMWALFTTSSHELARFTFCFVSIYRDELIISIPTIILSLISLFLMQSGELQRFIRYCSETLFGIILPTQLMYQGQVTYEAIHHMYRASCHCIGFVTPVLFMTSLFISRFVYAEYWNNNLYTAFIYAFGYMGYHFIHEYVCFHIASSHLMPSWSVLKLLAPSYGFTLFLSLGIYIIPMNIESIMQDADIFMLHHQTTEINNEYYNFISTFCYLDLRDFNVTGITYD